MKKLVTFISALLFASVISAQSLEILQPLQMVENSSVMVQYQNRYGKHNMPDIDVSFPFALISIRLEGSGTEVTAAQQVVDLYMGSQTMVADVERNLVNEIQFLVPTTAKNMYLRCGNGCQEQVLASGTRLRPNTVYRCKIKYTPEEIAYGPKKPKITSQYLLIHVTPADAIVLVDGNLWETKKGVAGNLLEFGEHRYNITATDYAPVEGKVVINDPNNTQSLNIQLKPRFCSVTLKVDNNAEIWVNGAKKGSGQWTGNLGYSPYRIETRLAGHIDGFIQRTISENDANQTILLPAPTPIYGSLRVETQPFQADIYIDGKNVGKTPKMLSEVIVGSHKVEVKMEGYEDLSTTQVVTEGQMAVVGGELTEKPKESEINDVKEAQNKIIENVRLGMISLHKENKVGDALRYLFGAQVLLADLPNKDTLQFTIPNPNSTTHMTILANSFISQAIKDILSGIQIRFDGFFPNSTTEAKLSFLYKGKAIANLDYIYNDNTGWSEDNMPVKDGWSVVVLSANNRPSTMQVKIEYRYADEAAFDPELKVKMAKFGNDYNYDKEALHVIEIKNQVIAELDPSKKIETNKEASRANTSMLQNALKNRVRQVNHKVSYSDSVAYSHTIEQICKAIIKKDYQRVRNCFTENGYQQFKKLICDRDACIIWSADYYFARIGSDVMCRSIPMQFSLTPNKQILENVVFTFDETKKVNSVQIAINERLALNIMADVRIAETQQLMLIHFLENYLTSYALKDIDYIASTLSPSASILSVQVGKKKGTTDVQDSVYVISQPRQQYLDYLAKSFNSKGWIDVNFGNIQIEKVPQGMLFEIQMLQDYVSSNYVGRGYLSLLVDLEEDKPLVRIRMWQPIIEGKSPLYIEDVLLYSIKDK